ncbi:hypothetical protein [Streptomyces sp. NPDC088762]|uniref:hypothetical protein n=1 Tax=Streptomyces sp. NPDC088762 TaxID=3365891 RepID=UPI0037F944AC
MASALFALALLAALAVPLGLRLRRNPAFVTGRDGRLSTSTALALAWTVMLVWLLLTILVYGLTAGGGVTWFAGSDGPLSPLTTVYLPLLGGPYAALIGAKTVVGTRLEHGTLAKPAPQPTASGRRPLRELIANDGGRTDLVDLQYVTLNAVTMLYVALFFLSDVGEGLPRLPSEIWALTGAPAGAYLLNKLATRANPVITRVSLSEGHLTVEGGGFTEPRVSVDGTPLPTTPDPAADTLTAPLPETVRPPFTVVVTSRGLRSDPFRYEPPAPAPAVPQRAAAPGRLGPPPGRGPRPGNGQAGVRPVKAARLERMWFMWARISSCASACSRRRRSVSRPTRSSRTRASASSSAAAASASSWPCRADSSASANARRASASRDSASRSSSACRASSSDSRPASSRSDASHRSARSCSRSASSASDRRRISANAAAPSARQACASSRACARTSSASRCARSSPCRARTSVCSRTASASCRASSATRSACASAAPSVADASARASSRTHCASSCASSRIRRARSLRSSYVCGASAATASRNRTASSSIRRARTVSRATRSQASSRLPESRARYRSTSSMR